MKTLWEAFANWNYSKEQLDIYSKEELIDMYIELQNKNIELNLAIDEMTVSYAKKYQLLLLNQARVERMLKESEKDNAKQD